MDDLSLRLFGAIHVDRVRKVEAELDEFASGGCGDGRGESGRVDALFVEYPSGEFGLRQYLRFVVRVPTVAVGWGLVTVVHTVFYLLSQRDVIPAEVVAAVRYAKEHDRPLHAVDDHPIRILSGTGPAWVVVNWLAFVGLLWATRFDGAVTAATLATAQVPL
ncbi:hypothetical protein ACFQE1_17110, partial [Halobium palmae]